jgi:valyl-tRNA synthetase
MDEEAERGMGLVMELVRGIRNARAEFAVEAGRRIEALIVAGDQADLLRSQSAILCALARLDPARLVIEPALPGKPSQAVAVVAGPVECYLPLAGMVDLAAERQRLQREISETEAEAARAAGRLENAAYVSRAPAAVVEKDRARLEELSERASRLSERLASLS